jgi:PAS domain S-box-containing protein
VQPIRVLLVDDDQSYHVLTSRMLSKADQPFDVDWVGTFDEGLEKMLKQEHDIYLLDYQLGRTSGLELMKSAQSQGVDKPIIMMTGHGKHGLDVEALQSGATDYIDKVELRPTPLQRSLRYALERWRIRQEREQSQMMYRTLIEEAFDGIIITDTTGEIEVVNPRLCELILADADAIKEQNITKLIHAINQQINLLEVGTGIVLECLLKRNDKGDLDVEVSGKMVGDEHIQYIVRDISARQDTLRQRDQYIEQLQILHQVDDEISQVLDTEYVMMMALDSAMRLSGGYAGFIALLNEDTNTFEVRQSIGQYYTLDPTDYLPKMPFLNAIRDQQEGRLILDVTQSEDYRPILEQTQATIMLPMLSYDKMVGVMNLEANRDDRFTQDIFDFLKLIASRVAVAIENATLYKVAQDRFNELQALYTQVSGLEQIKTDMIRIAAHDIRNPVSVILGYTELMEALSDDVPEKFLNYARMIEKSARRLEKITTDILSLERIENLQGDEDMTLDITNVIQETFEEFEGQAALKSQNLSLQAIKRQILVKGDAAQMREAAANLISNAIKYTQNEGDIHVYLKQKGDAIEFTVVDNGFGIPEDQQGNLFQPFYRASSRETREVEGTGLGLYLIKSIIERYDGTLIFHSVYGEGSTFGFSLPLVQ